MQNCKHYNLKNRIFNNQNKKLNYKIPKMKKNKQKKANKKILKKKKNQYLN